MLKAVRVAGPAEDNVGNDGLLTAPLPPVLGAKAVLAAAAAAPSRAALPAMDRHRSPSDQATSCHAARNTWAETDYSSARDRGISGRRWGEDVQEEEDVEASPFIGGRAWPRVCS